ncbi:MAG: hypothetical protein J6B37_03710 [Clostridia bacterium]|nr:hypothetical protein [Clostridia bacterium]
MFCGNCGKPLNENGVCSNCGKVQQQAQSVETVETVQPTQPVQPTYSVPPVQPAYPVQPIRFVAKETPLTKCAWFAPVAAGLISVLTSVVSSLCTAIASVIINELYDYEDIEYHYFSQSGYSFANAIGGIISLAIIVVLSYVLYSVALKDRKKDFFALAVVPFASSAIVSRVSGVFNAFVQGILYNTIMRTEGPSAYASATLALSIFNLIFVTVLSAVMAYFVVLKCLEREEKKIK